MKKYLILFLSIFIISFSSKAVDFYIGASIVSPSSGCELSNSETVTIIIGNAGTMTIAVTNFDVSYTVNGVTVTESTSVNAGWASSATYTYTFSTNADLTACQEHVFDFSLTLAGDTNPANNDLSISVFSDCPPTLGSMTAPSNVCIGDNSGDIELTGYNGVIADWQTSTDSGGTWTTTGNTTSTQPYNNINQNIWYWVILDSPFGFCVSDTTPYQPILVDQLSDGSVLNANQNVCSNGNSGLLELSGFVGDISYWDFSIDGGVTWNNLTHTNDTLWYSDVFTTTQYQVVVQNGTCPPDTSTIAELTVIAGSDAGMIIGEDTVCNAMADSLLSVSGYYGNVDSWIYSKDSGMTWVDANSSAASYSYAALLGYTIFGVVVQEGACPADTAFHPIIVLPINVSGGPNMTIYEEDSTQLAGSGGLDYVWSPDNYIDDPLSATPTVFPPTDITYSVEVTDQYGCKDTAFVIITVNPNLENIIIPTLLTPNGDGYNDVWNIKNIETYDQSEVYVFDAYGKVVFEAKPYLNNWDTEVNGAYLPDGTYFYLVRLDVESEPIKGTLTIVSQEK